MNLEDFSIFDTLGMTEQELKTVTNRSLHFWLLQVRKTKDPAEALRFLNMTEEWTPEQSLSVVKGMLILNLVSFLTSNKIDFLDYEGWERYMKENPFAPAISLGIPNSEIIALSVRGMKILRPKVTRDMVTSGRAPKPQKLLKQLIEVWARDKEEKILFFIGWAIYATVMKTQAQAGMSIPIEKKAVSVAVEPDKEIKPIEESGQLCDVNDLMARIKRVKA